MFDTNSIAVATIAESLSGGIYTATTMPRSPYSLRLHRADGAAMGSIDGDEVRGIIIDSNEVNLGRKVTARNGRLAEAITYGLCRILDGEATGCDVPRPYEAAVVRRALCSSPYAVY